MEKDTTPESTEADTVGTNSDLLSVVVEDFDAARRYVKQNYQGIWEDCFKAYNGIRTRRNYSGTADEFVPETFSIVEALKSSIAGTKPKFKFMPLTEEQEQDATILNNLVDYFWSMNNMTEKLLNWVEDMIVYGNGIFMVSWDSRQEMPLIQHIPLSDFFVDPTATHINRPEEPGYARYAGYRYLTSLQQLQEEKTLDDDGNWVPMYNNLTNINLSNGGNDDDLDKDRKEKWLGSTLGKEANKEQVEVIVYFTRRKKIVIANRSTVIYSGENPYHRPEKNIKTQTMVNGEMIEGTRKVPEIQGFLPFAILRNYVDSNLFFARGDVEVILPTQEALNDTASQKRDNISYVLNNMWQIDPRFKHLAEQIESSPGAIFPIPKGALTPIDKQDMSNAADNEISRQTQQMRTATAADAAVQGVSQNRSRTTATEIQAQLNQASTRFTTKVQTLEDEGFAQLARIIYKMSQIFITTERAVRIVGRDGMTWATYSPQRYTGEYEPRVVLEATANAELAAQSQAMQVASQIAINNPLVNQKEFLRDFFETLFPDKPKDRINDYLNVPQPIMGPDGQAMDPSLAQSNPMVTPQAAAALRGETPDDAPVRPNRFGGTVRGKATQSGNQGGGGADSSPANVRRTRAAQPSTRLAASSQPRVSR